MKLDLSKLSVRLALADIDLGARIAFAQEWHWHHFGDLFVSDYPDNRSPNARYRDGWDVAFGNKAPRARR